MQAGRKGALYQFAKTLTYMHPGFNPGPRAARHKISKRIQCVALDPGSAPCLSGKRFYESNILRSGIRGAICKNAKNGIKNLLPNSRGHSVWIPACAGMTLKYNNKNSASTKEKWNFLSIIGVRYTQNTPKSEKRLRKTVVRSKRFTRQQPNRHSRWL